MPDLLYYPSLNTFTRTPDLDSYILLVDQSGVNPVFGRFTGDEISKGISAVTSNINFFDGSGGKSVTGSPVHGALNPRTYKGANIQIDAVFNKAG